MEMTRKYTEEEKRNLVQTFMGSGESMQVWCKKMKLPYSTFHGWVKKCKEMEEYAFIELTPSAPPKVTASNEKPSSILIEYENFKINISEDVELCFLEKVLKVVATLNV
ncbi:MAG: IS66 family insertion sequence element accessory protein TnpA [Lachnospiraceae bacterium]